MFIKITSSGLTIYANINLIEQFAFIGEKTHIFFSNVDINEPTTKVDETPEQIMKLIEEARKCL